MPTQTGVRTVTTTKVVMAALIASAAIAAGFAGTFMFRNRFQLPKPISSGLGDQVTPPGTITPGYWTPGYTP